MENNNRHTIIALYNLIFLNSAMLRDVPIDKISYTAINDIFGLGLIYFSDLGFLRRLCERYYE